MKANNINNNEHVLSICRLLSALPAPPPSLPVSELDSLEKLKIKIVLQ